MSPQKDVFSRCGLHTHPFLLTHPLFCHTHARLEVKSCSCLWYTYIEAWNGTGLFPRLPDGPSITADASGSWGAGAFISLDHAWFQIQWPDSWSATNIAAKELLPIVVALAIWGHRCAATRVTLYSDNYAVVQCLETRSAKDPNLAHFTPLPFLHPCSPQHILQEK